MERAYQRRYPPRTAARRTASRTPHRSYQSKKMTPERWAKIQKRLGIQAFICGVIFAILWATNATDTRFSAWIKRNASYAITLKTDMNTAYTSAVGMSQGIGKLLIRETPITPTTQATPAPSQLEAEASPTPSSTPLPETSLPPEETIPAGETLPDIPIE